MLNMRLLSSCHGLLVYGIQIRLICTASILMPTVNASNGILTRRISKAARGPTQSHIQGVPGVKYPGHEADHSAPSNDDVKNEWSYTSTVPHVFMAWFLIKHRENFQGKGKR
jgi:hypothetical protein